jgi:hypothetical protein
MLGVVIAVAPGNASAAGSGIVNAVSKSQPLEFKYVAACTLCFAFPALASIIKVYKEIIRYNKCKIIQES